MRTGLVAAPVAVLLMTCGSPGKAWPPMGLADGCQPLLGGADCFLPYPSDFYRVESAGGARLQVQGAAIPMTQTRPPVKADVHAVVVSDGYSKVPTLVTMFPEDVADTGFVHLEDGGAASLSAAGSNTLIVKAGTAAPVAHWVDLDPRATDPLRRALVLHVFEGLEAQTRYVVLIKGVTTTAGAPVAAPEGFRRLRDGEAKGDAALEALAPGYEADVFPAARAMGVERRALQQAWVFTTGSDAWAQRDLLRVRELTMAWNAAHTPAVTITQVQDAPPALPEVARVVRGTMEAPLFLKVNEPFGQLNRDADGQVALNGTTTLDFTVVVPWSVAALPGPAGTVLFGHGFFGSMRDVEDPPVAHLGQAATRSMIATNWLGMSTPDLGKLLDALSAHPSHTMDFGDRVHQAMANWLVLSHALDAVAAQPELRRADGTPYLRGPADSFLGISMGHILGGTMAALNPDLTRVSLNVGGAGFTHIMMRARPFSGFLEILAVSIPDALEQQKLIATMQRPFDRFDPATWAPHLLTSPLPGNPPKHVLMQLGLCDGDVPNLATLLHARLAKVPLMTPVPWTPWGLEPASPDAPAALEIFDLHQGDPAVVYRPADFQPTENGVHEGMHQTPRAIEQLKVFWDEGVVRHPCAGPCDPD